LSSVLPVFGTGPVTLQTPHGREVALQESVTVTSPFEITGARCAMPVHPVSRIVPGLLASAAKWILVGQAQVQLALQVKAALVLEAF
jgi:hypothetical protein